VRVVFCFLILCSVANSSTCKLWFEKQKISPDEKFCIDKCYSANVGMGTFSCPLQCKDFCNQKSQDLYFAIAGLYPALTLKEREVCVLEKAKCAEAYYLSWRAEKACKKAYGRSVTNDISDACRHFHWAYLLQRDLGNDFSKKILSAHEENPRIPLNEKEMDQHNNKMGIEAAIATKDKKLSDEAVIELFKTQDSEKKIKVIRGVK
jgi:hypothetical protein